MYRREKLRISVNKSMRENVKPTEMLKVRLKELDRAHCQQQWNT